MLQSQDMRYNDITQYRHIKSKLVMLFQSLCDDYFVKEEGETTSNLNINTSNSIINPQAEKLVISGNGTRIDELFSVNGQSYAVLMP